VGQPKRFDRLFESRGSPKNLALAVPLSVRVRAAVWSIEAHCSDCWFRDR